TGVVTPYSGGHFYTTCVRNTHLNLTMLQTEVIANGERQVIAKVNKSAGEIHNPTKVSGTLDEAEVDLSYENSGDNSSTITTSSTTAGTYLFNVEEKVDATSNLNSRLITYVADKETAEFLPLNITVNNAASNGKSADKLVVTLTDANGNPISGATITVSLTELGVDNNSASVKIIPVVTDSNGSTTIQVYNTETEQVSVQVEYITPKGKTVESTPKIV
ncbi:Ig-like domain-containing protein, partial [Photobacterium kishitanii]